MRVTREPPHLLHLGEKPEGSSKDPAQPDINKSINIFLKMKRTCCLGSTCSHPDDATNSWAVAGGRLSALSSQRAALPSRVSSSCPVPARLAAATHLLHRASCSSPRAIATGHCPALLLGAHAVLRTCLENRLMGCDHLPAGSERAVRMLACRVIPLFFLFLVIFIYLAVAGLSCGTRDL